MPPLTVPIATVPVDRSTRELTGRGLVLGAAITVVFIAANVYLGLRVGLTFASSIPAAVISMALLRTLGGSSVRENNIVQTVASAAGTLSSIIFVIPALVMVGWWHGFPWFETAGICAAGGTLGVLFTIPLRRALVTGSDLAFPEGVAAAAVLTVGAEQASGGVRALAAGTAVSGVFAFCSGALGLLADGAATTLAAGPALFRLATGFSFALVGAGYLMGIAAGVAVGIGVLASWGVAVPILTALTPRPPGLADTAWALAIWSHKVRLIGAGTIAISSIWTLVTLVPAITRGLRDAAGAARGARHGLTADIDRDLAGRTIGAIGAAAVLALFALFAGFLGTGGFPLALILFATAFAALFGFVVAAACGYMAGIVGSSASPISGIGIMAVTLCSLALLAMPVSTQPIAVPLALFVTSAVLAIATISNDNLQDLKTGQLVGATPARQQAALIVGVLVGAAVIPPLLDLLYRAYGFAGALPRPGADPAHALAAPQASLMATLASGILGHALDWTMITIGLVFGASLIALDLLLRRTTRTRRLPALAAGIGLYLPPTVGVTLVIGALLSFVTGRMLRRRDAAAGAHARHTGTLLASGLIVGDSLVGVLIAFVIAGTGRQDALAVVGPGFAPVALAAGAILFAAGVLFVGRAIVAPAPFPRA